MPLIPTSRMAIIVRFFHRNDRGPAWVVYEEYGMTMRDIAMDKAKQLSVPFGNAEVRVVQYVQGQNWEDGILLELHEAENEVFTNHFTRE